MFRYSFDADLRSVLQRLAAGAPDKDKVGNGPGETVTNLLVLEGPEYLGQPRNDLLNRMPQTRELDTCEIVA
jgi:hypothetical protein